MSFPKMIMAGEQATRRQVLVGSAIITVVGVALIVIGVVADWGQTRLPGAVLITIGGAGIGIALGFSSPMRDQIWSRLATWRVWIAIITAIVVATPAVLAMGSATIGPLAGGGDAQNTVLVAVGALIGLIFLAGTVIAAIVAVQAVQRRVAPEHEQEPKEHQREERA